jgi:PAS domain S-box-containing protein
MSNGQFSAGDAERLEYLSQAVEAAQIGVYEWDPPTGRVVWSDIMRRWHGLGQEVEVTPENAMSCVHPDDVERVRLALESALDPGGDGHFEVEYRTLCDGVLRWIESVGRVRFQARDGSPAAARLLGVVIDVTARREMENELQQASYRKDEFLAFLGHELRNPLAALRTASELMRCGELEPHQLHAIQGIIGRQVRHMSRIVDDLLDTTRIRQGKLSLDKEPVELKPLLAEAIDAARSFTEPRRIHVVLDVSHEPIWVEGDPVRLTQVVSNLLHNAAKFSDDDASISVALEQEGQEAVIRVSDGGRGIPQDLLPHIFDLFTQGEAKVRSEKGGLGLGLALVRNLARLHGGTVSAASRGPEMGSQFEVRLPLIRPPERVHPEPASAPTGTSRRVLVVDDNSDAAESLSMMLEMSGHIVKTAGDGEKALALVERWSPEFMLVDIGLPGIDGYEVARRLRARSASRGAVLVALTGYGGADERRRSLEAGFDYHMVKPVVPEELFRLLRGSLVPKRPITAGA